MKKTMTNRLTNTAMMLIFTMLTTNIWAQTTLTLSGGGTEQNPYLIGTAADWDNLADYVAEGNNCANLFFQMTANIGTTESPITKPLGKQAGSQHSDRKRFAGIFDGDGHTLTVNITNENNPWYEYNKSYCAPFAYVQNVTIKNLHVTGTIVTTGQFASGLVGQSGPDDQPSLGACTIDNCHVSVNFVGNTTGNNTYGNHGTFISIAEGNATITNSWFDGSLTGRNYYYSGGFIGLNKATANLNNCFFNPSEISIENNNIGGSSEFVHNIRGTIGSLTNCYYTKSFSEPEDAQGRKVYESYDQGSIIENVIAADGNTYYIIIHNINWTTIQEALNGSSATITVNLPKDIIAGTDDTALVVPANKTASINLNGYTLDRSLDIVSAEANGYVIKVEAGASLTITDTSEGKTGLIKGGHNTGNGGGIYNEGTLVISDITISGNYADKGGAIYVNGGEVTVNGGTISGNKATTSDGASGSGIFLNNGTLTLNGCTININNSNKNNNSIGVGVYVNSGTFNIIGSVTIKDNKCSKSKTQQNVYLTSNEVMNVTGSINKASIRVSKENGGVITNGLSSYGTTSNFTSDNNDYAVTMVDNEVHLLPCVNLTVNGYNNSSNGKWVFIASPVVDDVQPNKVNSLLTSETTYDLYRFNQNAELEWENYKAHTNDFVLKNGKGYLYANKNKVTLKFIGTFNTGDTKTVDLTYSETNSDENMHGWNLVGNPFTEPATINRNYYKVNAEGTGIEPVDINENSAPIAPCTGVMVKAEGANETVTFSKNQSKSDGRGNLQITLTQANTRDKATLDKTIISFNEGSKLEKFFFGESDANISIPQGGKTYAIACAENQSEMPLRFKATKDGEYTLTFNPENVEITYLHLIDNLTGEDVDLLQMPEYSFSAKTSDYESRFRLVFSTNGKINTDEEPFAYFDGNAWIISNTGNASVQVIDVNGRLLSSEQISGNAKVDICHTPGVYMLRLVNGNDVKVQKIIIK